MAPQQMTYLTIIDHFFTGRGYVSPHVHTLIAAVRSVLIFVLLAIAQVIVTAIASGQSLSSISVQTGILDVTLYVVLSAVWRYMRAIKAPYAGLIMDEIDALGKQLDQTGVQRPILPPEQPPEEAK